MTTTTNNSNNEVYSTVSQIYDYLSIQGINTKFGLNSTDLDIFIIKELIDNALDFIEQNAKEFVNGKCPFVDVIITEDNKKEVVKIRVRNSNAGINNIFTKERINKIFTLHDYYSSKRYRHKINRGELGDAFKAILCIPYAVAVNSTDDDYKSNNNRYQNWDYPLEINVSNDNRSIKVWIDNIDKIRRKEELEVKKEYNTLQQQQHQDKEQITDDSYYDNYYNYYNQQPFTEIVVYLPKTAVNYSEISDLLKKYVVENTHIEFSIQLSSQQQQPYFYPATQKIKNDWKNKESIYSYTLSEIKEYFRSIDKSYDNLNVYDEFVYKNFREGTTLAKDEVFKKLTFGDLKSDDNKIEYIVQKMKDNQKPIKYQSTSLSKLDLPFDIKFREQALKERLRQVYYIEEDSFIYKKFDKYYESADNGIQFPYKLEVVIAKSHILEEKLLTLIESLNFSPSLHTDSLFTANDWIFHLDKIKIVTKDVTTILQNCGYSIYNGKEHKKPYNLIIVNLISPRIDYNSHSKSNINLLPFAETFSKELYRTCKSSNSNNNRNKNDNSNEGTNIGQLRILLKERLESVLNNPELKNTDRWTQSTVYYILRKRLIDKGIPVRGRDYITGEIKNECEKLGIEIRGKGFKRHELGIIAAERAQLYFDGQVLGVSFDQLEELMKKGTDLLVIEKEGIADVLIDFANKWGIAILNSRGFLTEYATELSELAEKEGCNIAILTDWDSSGLLISSNLQNAYRIGIDLKTLEKFGLLKEDLEEKVLQKKERDNHLKNIKKLNSEHIPSPYSMSEWYEMIKYLEEGRKRIEIDSVIARVGSKAFWDFIIKELDKIFPERDYNRAIKVPKCVLPIIFEQFKENVSNIVSEIQSPIREKLIKILKHKKGFLDVKEEEKKIEEGLRSFVDTDEVKNKISEEFKKLFN
jgi:hypothetical protein